MADTPSSILLLRLQTTGSNTNLWGGYINTALQTLEQAAKGYQTLAVTGNAMISWSNYSTGNTGQCAHLVLTGTLSSAAALTFPTYQNSLVVHNTAGATVTILCSGGTGVAIPNGRRALIHCDGITDYATDVPNWTPESITLTNAGDIVNFTNMTSAITTAIAAASIAVSGQILNTVSDSTPGYNTTKNRMAADTLLTYTTQNAGANEYQELSDRRARRRTIFIGQV